MSDENRKEGRRIKGKIYSEEQIEAINEEASQFNCPFTFVTQTLHNDARDYRVTRCGINARRDNDITYTNFANCIGCDCMAFDPDNILCLRCK